MNPSMTFKAAFRALNRNRLRTSLTMLGIIIGVAAVIIMVGVVPNHLEHIQARTTIMNEIIVVVPMYLGHYIACTVML